MKGGMNKGGGKGGMGKGGQGGMNKGGKGGKVKQPVEEECLEEEYSH